MNLGDAKRQYREVLAAARLAASEDGLPEAAASDAERRLDAVHKDAMRSIDQYTTRRFLSINERTGLVTKLEQLHRQAQADLRLLAAGRRRHTRSTREQGSVAGGDGSDG
ncbi:hypothetical protein AB0C74_38565 [Spirillospora sp. NPDC048832]